MVVESFKCRSIRFPTVCGKSSLFMFELEDGEFLSCIPLVRYLLGLNYEAAETVVMVEDIAEREIEQGGRVSYAIAATEESVRRLCEKLCARKRTIPEARIFDTLSAMRNYRNEENKEVLTKLAPHPVRAYSEEGKAALEELRDSSETWATKLRETNPAQRKREFPAMRPSKPAPAPKPASAVVKPVVKEEVYVPIAQKTESIVELPPVRTVEQMAIPKPVLMREPYRLPQTGIVVDRNKPVEDLPQSPQADLAHAILKAYEEAPVIEQYSKVRTVTPIIGEDIAQTLERVFGEPVFIKEYRHKQTYAPIKLLVNDRDLVVGFDALSLAHMANKTDTFDKNLSGTREYVLVQTYSYHIMDFKNFALVCDRIANNNRGKSIVNTRCKNISSITNTVLLLGARKETDKLKELGDAMELATNTIKNADGVKHEKEIRKLLSNLQRQIQTYLSK